MKGIRLLETLADSKGGHGIYGWLWHACQNASAKKWVRPRQKDTEQSRQAYGCTLKPLSKDIRTEIFTLETSPHNVDINYEGTVT